MGMAASSVRSHKEVTQATLKHTPGPGHLEEAITGGPSMEAHTSLQWVQKVDGRRASKHRVFTYFCLQSLSFKGNKKEAVGARHRSEEGFVWPFQLERSGWNYRLLGKSHVTGERCKATRKGVQVAGQEEEHLLLRDQKERANWWVWMWNFFF